MTDDLTILRGDTVDFSVYATDLQDDSLSYLWTLDGDSVGNDTFWVHTFAELDTNLVKCVVSDSTGADSALWTVYVKELYITEKHPETSSVRVLRRQEQQFSIVVRATEDEDPVEKVWRLDGDQVGDGDTLLYRFNFPREYELLAVASRGEYSDTARWTVDVRSVISRWLPVEDSLSILRSEGIEFWIAPFNPESDSLTYLWTLNGDSVWNDQLWFQRFEEVGVYEMGVRLFDGAEGDSVFWTINVQELDVVDDKRDAYPTRMMLYPAFPNPFNASTTIRYQLPVAGSVNLGVYDIWGREILHFVQNDVGAGMHQVQLDASDLPAGIYILNLRAGDVAQRQKAVVVK